MTKARTAAQRRRDARARRRQISLSGVDPVVRPATRGPGADDAPATALRARCKRLGLEFTPATRKLAQAPQAGDDLGLCIMAIAPSRREQDDLWSIWQAISSAKRNWQQRITSTNPSPQSAALAMMPEAIATDDAHSIDTRTAEDRDIGAIRAWHYWNALLIELAPGLRHALRGHLDGYGLPLWRAAPTDHGRSAVAALRALFALHS